MTQEDKELLLQDLCTRLSYGVYVHIRYKEGEPCYGKLTPRDIQWFIDSNIEVIKPYLRSMSSMTDEEWEDYQKIRMIDWVHGDINGTFINAGLIVDWLNAHHFDYRGLIEKELAIAVTEEYNPYKE